MTAEHEVHLRIVVSTDSYQVTCTECGEEIIRGSTGDRQAQKQVAKLGWLLASGHICAKKGEQASLSITATAG